MKILDLVDHLGSLDHGHVADLVGDARILELVNAVLRQRGDAVPRGQLLLDALGGPQMLLEDPKKRRALFVTFTRSQEEKLKNELGVSDLYSMRLIQARREALYNAFGFTASAPETGSETPFATPADISYGLFPHQSNALFRCAETLAEASGRVMLHMPTGSGKTRTAMHLVGRHLNTRRNALVVWLVSGLELCEQAALEFKTAWHSLGERPIPLIRLWGGKTRLDEQAFADVQDRSRRPFPVNKLTAARWPADLKDGFLVGSLASVAELVNKWEPGEIVERANNVSLVVFDEAHQAVALTYKRALETVGNKASVLGLSATPGRRHHGAAISEDETLVDLFGGEKVVLSIPGYDSPVEGLIDQGYLARLEKEELQIANSDMKKEELELMRMRLSANLDLDEESLRMFGLDATRNLQVISRIEELIESEAHKRVIVFAPSVFSSDLIANLLRARGIWAESITMNTTGAKRENLLREFRNADPSVRVLTNFGVLTTGFDAPRTSAVVIARPTNSIVLLSQMAGRAIRGPKVGGTELALLVTVVDTAIPELVDTVQQFHAFDRAWSSAS